MTSDPKRGIVGGDKSQLHRWIKMRTVFSPDRSADKSLCLTISQSAPSHSAFPETHTESAHGSLPRHTFTGSAEIVIWIQLSAEGEHEASMFSVFTLFIKPSCVAFVSQPAGIMARKIGFEMRDCIKSEPWRYLKVI